MLILTRRKGEAVDIIDRERGDVLCTVTLLELLPNGTVRIGFDAPEFIRIIRDNAVRRHDDGESESESEVNGNR